MLENKQLFSIMYFEAGKGHECGVAWNYGRESGSLDIKLNLDGININRPLMLKAFPTAELNSYQMSGVLLSKLFEKAQSSKLLGLVLSRSPIFKFVIKQEEKCVHVGSFWLKPSSEVFDFEIREDFLSSKRNQLQDISGLLLPSKKIFLNLREPEQVNLEGRHYETV